MNRADDTSDSQESDDLGSSDDDDSSPPSLEPLECRLDALSRQTKNLRQEVDEARQERAALRAETEALQEKNADLRRKVESLDARTNLLEVVETADSIGAEQRALTLVQHLKRGAERRQERDEPAQYSVNRNEAEAALHHPDVHRTTIYEDMERAVRLVGAESVLWYESNTGGESRLKLDLEADDLPSEIIGQTGGNGGR